jgi:hypothetical protein
VAGHDLAGERQSQPRAPPPALARNAEEPGHVLEVDYGLRGVAVGGLLVPFIGIKLLDWLVLAPLLATG